MKNIGPVVLGHPLPDKSFDEQKDYEESMDNLGAMIMENEDLKEDNYDYKKDTWKR